MLTETAENMFTVDVLLGEGQIEICDYLRRFIIVN